MRQHHILLGLSLAAGVGAAGCTNSMSSGDDDAATYNCSADTRATPYVPGMEVHGESGKLDFKLLTATPAPPMSGNNNWLLEIDSMSANVVGAPMSGATMTISPYMPDHGHTSPINAAVTPSATSGQYEINPVNLWMPGFWTVTIDATTPDSTEDKAVFDICIAS